MQLRRALSSLSFAAAIVAGSLAVALVSRDDAGLPEANAKQTYDSLYTYEQTWNTALRLIRVDKGFKVVEKDEKAGFVLFEYVDKDATFSGSMELLRGEKSVR